MARWEGLRRAHNPGGVRHDPVSHYHPRLPPSLGQHGFKGEFSLGGSRFLATLCRRMNAPSAEYANKARLPVPLHGSDYRLASNWCVCGRMAFTAGGLHWVLCWCCGAVLGAVVCWWSLLYLCYVMCYVVLRWADGVLYSAWFCGRCVGVIYRACDMMLLTWSCVALAMLLRCSDAVLWLWCMCFLCCAMLVLCCCWCVMLLLLCYVGVVRCWCCFVVVLWESNFNAGLLLFRYASLWYLLCCVMSVYRSVVLSLPMLNG